MNEPMAAREKGTELYEVHQQFITEGKQLSDHLQRLEVLSTKLEDRSSEESDQAKTLSDKGPRPAGIVANLWEDATGFRSLNMKFQSLLTKLEKLI